MNKDKTKIRDKQKLREDIKPWRKLIYNICPKLEKAAVFYLNEALIIIDYES